MRTRLSILLVSVMVLTFVPLGPAVAENGYWPIGENTTLTVDYHGQIEITADNITVDCADGVEVIGDGSGTGIYLSNKTGVTIRGCDVHGFQSGIVLSGSSGNTIEGNYVHTNDINGFLVVGESSGNALIGNIAN